MDAMRKNEDIYSVKSMRAGVFIHLTFGEKSLYQAFLAEVSRWGLQSS